MGRWSPRAFVLAAAALAVPAAAGALGVATDAFAAAAVVESQGVIAAAGTEQAVVTATIHDTKHATVTSVPAGTTVHGSVAVSGRAGTPTGTVKISIYANGECTGAPIKDANGSLSGGALDLTSLTHKPLTPGTISFRGSYGGDTTYATALSACRPLTVTRATPSMTSTIHDTDHAIVSAAYVSEQVHFNLVMSGAAGTPTGTVQIHVYEGPSCEDSPKSNVIRTLAGGTADGPSYTALFADVASMQATYFGDDVYNTRVGTCMPITFSKAPPTFSLGAHTGNHTFVTTVEVGTALHPAGTLGGPIGAPDGGELRLWTYPEDACQGTPVSKAFSYGDGEFDDSSVGVSYSTPTVRSWKVTYGGDSRYLSGSSGCLVLRWKGDSSVVVTVHDAQHQPVTSLPAGTFAHSAATVTGDFGFPSGVVLLRTFRDSTCGSLLAAQGVNLANGFGHGVTELYLNKVGAFSFRAHYNGSDAYLPADSLCVTLTVTKAAPTLETAVHDAGHAHVYSVAPGTAVHPDVTVGGPLGTPTGAVEASLFGNAGCTGSSLLDSATIPLASGAVDLTGFAQAPASPGTYAFEIRYGGSASYQPMTACTSFVVLAPGATPPPTPSPAPTLAPGATATVGPSGGLLPTPGAGASLPPGASPEPSASVAPGTSVAPGGSGEAPSLVPGATPSQGPDGSPAADGGAGGLSLPLLVLAILAIGGLVGGAFWLGRRGRAAS